MPAFGALCRGSWALGTACGRCSRCIDTAPAEIIRLRAEIENIKKTHTTKRNPPRIIEDEKARAKLQSRSLITIEILLESLMCKGVSYDDAKGYIASELIRRASELDRDAG